MFFKAGERGRIRLEGQADAGGADPAAGQKRRHADVGADVDVLVAGAKKLQQETADIPLVIGAAEIRAAVRPVLEVETHPVTVIFSTDRILQSRRPANVRDFVGRESAAADPAVKVAPNHFDATDVGRHRPHQAGQNPPEGRQTLSVLHAR